MILLLGLAVIPTLIALALAAIVVVWLTREWRSLAPRVRWGCVVAAAVLLLGTAWQARQIVSQPQHISPLTWVMWGIQTLLNAAVATLGIVVMRWGDEESE